MTDTTPKIVEPTIFDLSSPGRVPVLPSPTRTYRAPNYLNPC